MKRMITATMVVTLTLGGCATTSEQDDGGNDKAVTGAIIGGIIGGVLANNAGRQSTGKTIIGAAAGAAAGGVIGHQMDKRETQLRQIAAERNAKEVEIERLREDVLRVSVSSEASFDFDRAELKPEFKPTLNKVAGVLRDDAKLQIRVVGHTDSVGSERYNQELSERRARSTANYLIAQGVASQQITAEGQGELQPRASNDNEAGRTQNRRVEIYLQQFQ